MKIKAVVTISKRPMKESQVKWMGQIPETWTTPKLLYVLSERISDGPHETPTYLDEGIPFISIDSLNDSKSINFEVVKRYISEEDYKRYCKKTIIKEGDILFSKAATIGKTAIVGKERFMVWSPLAIIKGDYHVVDNNYLYYLLNCDELIQTIALSGSMNTQINVGMREMEQARIPVPPLKEQHSIANYLDIVCPCIDSVVEKNREAIEEYKKLKQSIITEAVTKGIRSNRKLKASGVKWIGEIPLDWEVTRLKYKIDKSFKGNGITKDDVSEDGNTPCIRYGEIYSKYSISLSTCISKTNVEAISSPRWATYGDILCAGTGELVEEIGKSVVYLGDNKCLVGGDIVALQHSQNPLFLSYALNSSYVQGQRSFGKTKLKVVHISESEIKNVWMALPPLEEQREIADYLERKCSIINRLIVDKETEIDSLNRYKKSLIYEYVTGKKEVPNC